MIKSWSLFFGILVALGAGGANADTNWGMRAGSSANLGSVPAVRERQNVNYEKYQTRTLTRTYESSDGDDLYYTKPQNRSALYKQYSGANSSSARATKVTTRKSRSESVVATMKRKYYLAHPFFQPLGGMFGSITDFSYTTNSYDFNINHALSIVSGDGLVTPLDGITGTWDMNRFSIKEDFSYGITDRLAVLGMLEYDMNDYKFEWSDGSPTDKMEDDGVNLFGAGLQWRFADTEEWIAMLSGYYQHQKDVSDNFLLELKAGYKVSRSTIYGLARGWYLGLEGNSYGNFVDTVDHLGNYAATYIPYQVGEDSVVYLEAGLGVFSVLNEDWTLNVEAVFGNYDWHNSATIKGAIGWQPNDSFALNLYAKTVFYDSANDKELDLYWLEPNIIAQDAAGSQFYLDTLTKIGSATLDNYAETSVGVQAIFQF